MAKLHTFQETWKDLSQWTLTGTNASTVITVAGNQLSLANSFGTYEWATTTATFDCTETYCFIPLTAFFTGTTSYDFYFGISNGSAVSAFAWFEISAGNIYTKTQAATVFAGTTFDPVAHKWLKVSETGGNVYFWTSRDGITWTQLGTSVADPTTMTALTPLIRYELNAAVSAALLGGLNISPRKPTIINQAIQRASLR